MWNPLAPSAVGVHVDNQTVRWVRLSGLQEAPRVQTLDAEPIADGGASAALAAIASRQRGHGAVAVGHVDPILVRHLLVAGQLPDDPDAHPDWLAGEMHRAGIMSDPKGLAVHAHATRSTSDGADGGVALDLAARQAVESCRTTLEDVGLVVAAVVSPWSAVARFSGNGQVGVPCDGVDMALDVWEGSVVSVEADLELAVTPREGAVPPEFAVAFALARCGLLPADAPSFLGSPPAFLAQAVHARTRTTRVALAAAIALATVLGLSTFMQVRAAHRLTATEAELATLAPLVVRLREAEAQLAGRQAVRPSSRYPVAASALLYRLATDLPDNVWLDDLEFRADSSRLVLQGDAGDEVAVAEILDRLDASDLFDSARLDESRVRQRDPAATGLGRQFRVVTQVTPSLR